MGLSASKIRAAVKKVLSDPRYRDAARKMQAKLTIAAQDKEGWQRT